MTAGQLITTVFGPLTPARLSPVAWYTADPTYCFTDAAKTTPCGVGDTVYTWADRSGNGYDLVQSTAGQRPTLQFSNGKYRVRGDGVNDQMRTASSFAYAQPNTIGLVATRHSTTFNYYFSSLADFGCALFGNSGGLAWQMYAGAGGPPSLTVVSADALTQLTAEYNTSSSNLYVNGATTGSFNAGTKDGAGFMVFDRYLNDLPCDGDICEVVIVNRLLSERERRQLEAYLKATWGTP